ncbi:MAG: hypothetical protein ACK4NC_06495 [Candidatus Gracilibacteria bacterium]
MADDNFNLMEEEDDVDNVPATEKGKLYRPNQGGLDADGDSLPASGDMNEQYEQEDDEQENKESLDEYEDEMNN